MSLRARLEDAKRANWPTYVELYDLALVISLVDQDISAFSECMVSAPSLWHRQFHARYLAILLCDAAERLPGLLGNGLKCVRDLDIGAHWTKDLGAIRSLIVKFKSDNYESLKQIRNNVGAHRHREALSQITLMESLDPDQVHAMAAQLSDAMLGLIVFYTRLLRCIQNEGFMFMYGIRQVQKKNRIPAIPSE